MEPGIKAFFKRIVNTLFTGLLWMALNSTFGIMYDFAFIHDTVSFGNILYYIFFLISLAGLIWFYVWLWKKPLEYEEGD